MTLPEAVQLAFVLFTLVTFPIYILLFITMYKYRYDETLKSAFFKLMFSAGIADAGMIAVRIMGNTLAGSGWIPQVYIWIGRMSSTLNYAGVYGFGMAQSIGVLLVSVNRYTAYMRPFIHSKVRECFIDVRVAATEKT